MLRNTTMRVAAPPNPRLQRTPSAPLSRKPLGGRSGLLTAVAAALLVFSCDKEAKRAPVVVRNPDYIVARPIRREPDAEHTLRVEFPYAGAGYGYASAVPLLDLHSINILGATFAGGRTSIVGEATIWLPLTPEASQRLETWSAEHKGDYLGIFLRGKLVAVPQIKASIGGGIPLRVPSKTEGDVVIRELRNGGATQ
jgi:hypothetical protein